MPSVGKAIPHDSAVGHVTGEALFIDDITPVANELYVDFAGAPCAAGRLKSIDLTEAKKIPGVVGLYTHVHILGQNRFGPIICDEPFLVEDQISYLHQPVVVIAAESPEAAKQAREAVKIEVEQTTPVLSIEDAIDRQLFIGPERKIQHGDFEQAWKTAPHRLEGVFRSDGQEQFYLESQAAISYPREFGQVYVHASTQNPTELQVVLAEVLGLTQHQVVCECKRMGGAFGGKETQAAIPSLMVALVTQQTGRAARIIYNKDDDMKVTGKRHAYRSWYKVAFDDDGRILGAKLDFYSDGGAFADLSTSVMERTMLHADNAYYLESSQITGRICRTNYPPNTAFRGFGGPQAVIVIENVMQEIAQTLGKDAYDVRRVNLYGKDERNVKPYGQIVQDHVLHETFDQLVETSDYKARLKQVEEFNARSKTRLKGIAMTAVKFGISFTTKFLNQGNALVNVYTDGTVQVSTGATEMGQGVNTKIRQLIADQFGIPYEQVIMMTTTTEKNANTSPTAASAGTDLNGAAAIRACATIKHRMARFAASHLSDADSGHASSPDDIRFENGFVIDERRPDKRLAFGEFCNQARRERIDLCARGFYDTPGVDFNRETGRGNPFYYFTTGAAVAEVLIDRFTGDLKVQRVDLLMDIGRQINPGIDQGQVTGGFIQGMGWVTTEQLVYDETGELLSHSPTTYKIPGIDDVPPVFKVAFIDNPAHQKNIHSSKAVGEPPLMLGLAPWAAVKHALSFVNPGRIAPLELPATNEQILMRLTELAASPPAKPGAEGVAVERAIP